MVQKARSKFWSSRTALPRRCCMKSATGGRIAHPRVKKVQKSGTFCEKLCEKWGPLVNRGQAAPASPSPHAGGSHPVGTRLTPPPNSNHRHFHRFPSPAPAPKEPQACLPRILLNHPWGIKKMAHFRTGLARFWAEKGAKKV